MESLYALTGEHRYLRDLLMSGEIDEQTFSDSLEGIMFNERIEEKAAGYCMVDREMSAGVDILSAEIKRLTDRKRALENNQKRLRERLQDAMIEMELDKIKTPLFNLSIQNNPPSVNIDEDATVPNKFIRVKYEVDKTDKV